MKKILFIVCFILGSATSFAQRDLGYRGFVDIGGGIGMSPGSRFMVGLSTVHGYQATPFLFLGAGIAANDIAWKENGFYEGENDGIVAPIFGDIRFDLGAGRFSPFIDLRGGYDFICGNGIYLNPSIGVHYAKSDNFGFNLSFGYDIQGVDGNIWWDDKERKTVGYLTMKFGIDF